MKSNQSVGSAESTGFSGGGFWELPQAKLRLLDKALQPEKSEELNRYRRGRTNVRSMRSERILLNDSVRFCVVNLLWQKVSALDQGEVSVKKYFSCS